MTAVRTLVTDLGTFHVVADHAQITQIVLPNGTPVPTCDSDDPATNAVADRAVDQLTRYLAGELEEFDLPLDPIGTPFQRQVWFALAEIRTGRPSPTYSSPLASGVQRPLGRSGRRTDATRSRSCCRATASSAATAR